MEDYIHLGRKLISVQDHPDPLEGESLPRLQEAITRLSRDGPLFVSLLSPNDAGELSRLCDAVAAENGHTWRWQHSAEVRQTGRKLGGLWRRHRD
jgi:hypothetical protein